MKDIIFPITYKYDDKGIKQAESGLNKLGGIAEKAGIAVAAGLAVAAVAAVNLGIESVKAASSFQEATAAIGEVFGESAKGLENFAKSASTSLAQSQTQFLKSAKTFGIFGKAAGLADEDNAEFSKNLTILATDLASFNDTTVDEAITALGAALRGESEPIRRYGVLLDDATLKSRAMEMGIYDGNGALTQQQRVLAANAEIFAQTTTQQGDFARTSDGAANATRTLQAAFENLQISIGNALLPAVEAALPAITGFIDGLQSNPEFNVFLQELGDQLTDMVPDLLTTVENLLRLSIEVLPGLNPAMAILGDVANIVAVALGDVSTESGNAWKDLENLSIVVGAISGFFEDFDGWLKETKESLGGWGGFFQATIDSVIRILNPFSQFLNTTAALIQYISGNRIGALKTMGFDINVGADERRGPSRFAEGGLVMRPIKNAIVGEAGPEAIIPLDRFDDVVGKRGGSSTNINVTVNAGMGTDGAAVGEQIVNAIQRYERSSGPVFARA